MGLLLLMVSELDSHLLETLGELISILLDKEVSSIVELVTFPFTLVHG